MLTHLLAAALPMLTLAPDAEKTSLDVPETLWGIFFEDINWAADGGIYAEMVANRGFDWRTERPGYWEYDFRGGAEARVTQEWAKPLYPENAQYLRIEAIGAGTGCGVRNRGFANGMVVKAGAKYDLKFYARGTDGYAGGLRVVLEKPAAEKGKAPELLAEYTVAPGALKVGTAGATPFDRELADWTKFTAVLEPTADATNATLSVLLDTKGIVDLEFVSLFPQETYKRQPNGLRPDLVEKLAALQPKLIRFPGGCIAEGDDFMSWFDWKRSVGPVERRYLNENRWDTEGGKRNLVYWQTQGLGYFEYFRLCEDLGAEPLPICLAGLTCQYRRPVHYAPIESLDYFVTNIVDLIEFATGDPATNPWAKVRAEMGHPAPFKLHYVGIGNENWDKPFFDRFPVIASKVKALYPNVTIVSSSGPNVDEGRWQRAWEFMTAYGAEILDEHYYRPPDWFLKNANRYDTYSRTAPKVYAGEYACHEKGRENSLHSAICEAAMMCGFERNCDVVRMSSYAPLFNNLDAPGYHWRPDMIWFDKTRVFGTPNYYVQKLFATNRPDVTVPVKECRTACSSCAAGQDGLESAAREGTSSTVSTDGTAFWSVGRKNDGTVIAKLVNASGAVQPVSLDLALAAGTLTVETVTAADPNAVNTIDEPERVTIRTTVEPFAGGALVRELPPWSATVFKLTK